MRETYEEDILMIDEENVEEQLTFIRNVIWVADEHAEGYKKKEDEAARLLYNLMNQGNAEALNIRGAMYYEGKIEKQDLSRAIHWYTKAADAGSSLAMSNLGYAYLYGKGVEIDMQMAYKYLSMAADYEEWDAYNLLGDMYKDGIYVPKDLDMAFSLYTKCLDSVPHDASNDAYPAALTRLAECVIERLQTPKDTEMAVLLLNRAKDIVDIQIKEGNYYAPGTHERIKKDFEKIQMPMPKRKSDRIKNLPTIYPEQN